MSGVNEMETRRTELPVMEISIENEVEVSSRPKLDQSSPNMKPLKFWQQQYLANESPMIKEYSSLVCEELDSTLMNPIDMTCGKEVVVSAIMSQEDGSSFVP